MEYLAFVAIVSIMGYIMHRQQRTIEALTDKVMAKDYREYVSMQPKHAGPEKQRREPLSYFDDPELDDEVQ